MSATDMDTTRWWMMEQRRRREEREREIEKENDIVQNSSDYQCLINWTEVGSVSVGGK